jgi:tetratricopeptide (TPR) repeat protein
MSDGFNALYNNQPEKAQQAFTGALKLKPSSAEARSALNQSRQQITARDISSLLARAQTWETGERWQEALNKYSAALELDPGLAAAQAGKERTAVRAQTHEQLEQILAHPERLYDGGVLDETEAFYRKIRALANPGPVLSVQLDRLEQLLSRMSTPVSVQLLSDNLTTVTLYKVGELGYFASREISLRPGRYVAVGIREGYRDVRVEFTVDPDTPPPVIKILADDKITFGDKA